MEKIGVVGSGTMGSGIAQSFAQAGFGVELTDADQKSTARAQVGIAGSLDRMVRKSTLDSAARDSALSRITFSNSIESVSQCDVIVEAVYEDECVKGKVFSELDRICQPAAILASNTSSISITRLASRTGRPDRVIGMHFMNPVPVMKLVEVIRGLETSNETVGRIMNLCAKMGKTAVEVQDYPGFIANRVLMPMINEAMFALLEGVGTRDSIDAVIQLGLNHPMGPLKLADLIGLDVCLNIMRVLHAGMGDQKFRPCPLLVKMVDANLLGRKTGRGFYDYRSGEVKKNG
jgi:3-hydroxybutyryl-CoA dehydrogenase